ncbi:DNA-binding protein YbiB [Comamonas sp.]|uniref:DNA-binding protein YbiB n=1 Tax=Comamonas sp. TaxID=34028 RepID=UPI003A8D0C58
MSISPYIKDIGRGTKGARSLTREQAADLMGKLLDGQVSDLELGAFCIAMRFKGESAQELAGFLDATQQRLPAWPTASPAIPVVVLPSYNGARKLPNLVPLLAALLARQGLPVLVHGCDTEDKRVSTGAVWQQLGWPVLQKPTPLAAGQMAWMQTRHLLPSLERLLQVRRQIGLRNPTHTIVKLLNPLSGPGTAAAAQRSLLLASYTHPDYAHPMAETLGLHNASALLLRGTEGEAVAAPNREPASLGLIDGQICFERSAVHSSQLSSQTAGDEPAAPELPQGLSAAQTAQRIEAMLAGTLAIPAPITQQIAQIQAMHRAVHQPGAEAMAQVQSFHRCPD